MGDSHRPYCPLCTEKSGGFLVHGWRQYNICPCCDLVFVPPEYHLSPEEEKKRYLSHNNRPEDEGYKKFLRPVAEEVSSDWPVRTRGLDFGCGTGSPLARMLERRDMHVATYDPFFAPDRQVFEQTYDFITCTEVVEHLRGPMQEIDRLWEMLGKEGGLYIKTELRLSQRSFSEWHYIRDPTHICFFSPKTFFWLAHRLDAKLEMREKRVTVLRKQEKIDNKGDI